MIIGIKLLGIIGAIELGIMVLFAVTRFERWGAPWLVSLSDPLILSILSSIFIYLWVFRPIHDQARKNSLYAAVLNQLNTGVLITDNLQEDNPIVYANPAFLRISGYDEGDVLGRNPRFLKGPESIEEVARKISQRIREKRPVEAVQKNYRKDGTYYWNEMKISPVLDAQEKAINYVGLSNEVTKRVEMEQRLRELAQAVQQAGEAIVVVDYEGGIEFANPTFCHNTGYAFSELQALGGRRYIGADDHAGIFPPELRQTLEVGQVWAGRHPFPRKDGSSFDCLSTIAPIRNAEGHITHYVGVHRDITELVALENRLMQAKKMEAIGTLVGGIAHDFNNILAGMLGNIYMALREISNDSKAANRLKVIEKQGYQAADMIRQLLAFARKGKVVLVPTSLNDLLMDVVQTVSTTLPQEIELIYELPDESLIVRGDASLLLQAVVNLVNNARDALAGIRQPRIELLLHELAGASPEIKRLFSDAEMPDSERYACVRVRDNGRGMCADIMERVFDPFFTTKTSGKGTGLGMAMVKGCVEMHSGHIGVSSEPGKGTEFTIVLPCSDYVRMQGKGEETVSPSGGEAILVVTGDGQQRMLLKDMLVSMGYAVLVAKDGEDVGRICDRESSHLDLAIIDLDMPETGEDIASIVRSGIPGIPLLLVTSYDDGGGLQEVWRRDGKTALMNKPLRPAALSRAMRELLEHSRDANPSSRIMPAPEA